MRFRPYPEYRDSGVEWLGAIPGDWRIAPLFTVARERDVRNMRGQEANVLSLSYGRIVRRDVSDNLGLMPESFDTYQIVEPGDIVLRLTDLQNDKRSLRVGLVHERGIITSAYVALGVLARARVDARYASYLLHAYDVTKVFYTLGAGVRQTMKFDDLKRMPLLVPEKREQGAIVTFLDRETARIDALVAKNERLIELLQENRAALITKAVTRGLDPNVPTKDSGVEWLGEIPAHWDVKPLKAISELQTGLTLGKRFEGGGLATRPYLRVANVQDGHLALEDIAEVDLPEQDTARYELRSGDVLMTEGGDFDKLGRGHVWEGQVAGCLHQNHIFAVRPRAGALESYFLAHLMGSGYGRAYFTATSKQSTNLASTNSTKLRNLPVPLPDPKEQAAIVSAIGRSSGRMKMLVAKVRDAIERLKEYRTALISAAVTGKIDVRGEPA